METKVIHALDNECMKIRPTNKGRYERDVRFEVDSFTSFPCFGCSSTKNNLCFLKPQTTCHSTSTVHYISDLKFLHFGLLLSHRLASSFVVTMSKPSLSSSNAVERQHTAPIVQPTTAHLPVSTCSPAETKPRSTPRVGVKRSDWLPKSESNPLKRTKLSLRKKNGKKKRKNV